MIFITLGSQKFQFNRLLEEMDRLVKIKSIQEPVFAQIGFSDYKPELYEYKEFLDRDIFSKIMDQSDIIITHGGTGAIISAVKKGKKVIAVPRLAKYGEHVDDHQIQIVKQFSDNGIIIACMDMDIENALDKLKNYSFNTYESNTQRMIDSLDEFIEKVRI